MVLFYLVPDLFSHLFDLKNDRYSKNSKSFQRKIVFQSAQMLLSNIWMQFTDRLFWPNFLPIFPPIINNLRSTRIRIFKLAKRKIGFLGTQMLLMCISHFLVSCLKAIPFEKLVGGCLTSTSQWMFTIHFLRLLAWFTIYSHITTPPSYKFFLWANPQRRGTP